MHGQGGGVFGMVYNDDATVDSPVCTGRSAKPKGANAGFLGSGRQDLVHAEDYEPPHCSNVWVTESLDNNFRADAARVTHRHTDQRFAPTSIRCHCVGGGSAHAKSACRSVSNVIFLPLVIAASW